MTNHCHSGLLNKYYLYQKSIKKPLTNKTYDKTRFIMRNYLWKIMKQNVQLQQTI